MKRKLKYFMFTIKETHCLEDNCLFYEYSSSSKCRYSVHRRVCCAFSHADTYTKDCLVIVL